MRQDKGRLGPLPNDGLELPPEGMLRLLRLRLVLGIQKTALGDDDGNLLAQPLWLGGQRPRRRVAQEGEDGRRMGGCQLGAGAAEGLKLRAGQGGELGAQALRRLVEDVAQAGHRVVAGESRGGDALRAPERHRVAVAQAVREVRVEEGRGRGCPAELGAPGEHGVVVDGQAPDCCVLGPDLAAQVEQRLGQDEVVKGGAHGGRAEDVGRVVALDKGGRQQRVVAVAMRQEDVLGPLVVDDEARVQQQVERGEHEGRVPGGAGAAGQDQLAVRLGELPFEDFGAGGLRERRGESGFGGHVEDVGDGDAGGSGDVARFGVCVVDRFQLSRWLVDIDLAPEDDPVSLVSYLVAASLCHPSEMLL